MVQIYALSLNEISNVYNFDDLLKLTDSEKRERVRRFNYQADAKRCLWADLLVRDLITKQLGISNERIKFNKTEYGKPRLVNEPGFHFNVSHSGDYILCAISDEIVGIDIEEIKPIELSIGERFFHMIEYSQLLNEVTSKQIDLFYRFWTLKESYIKAIGTGLSTPLDSFYFQFLEDKNNGIEFDCKNDRRSFHFRSYPIDPSYHTALCSLSPDIPNHIVKLTTNDFIII
jgi:4'-phosphopantetheinyl transferase